MAQGSWPLGALVSGGDACYSFDPISGEATNETVDEHLDNRQPSRDGRRVGAAEDRDRLLRGGHRSLGGVRSRDGRSCAPAPRRPGSAGVRGGGEPLRPGRRERLGEGASRGLAGVVRRARLLRGGPGGLGPGAGSRLEGVCEPGPARRGGVGGLRGGHVRRQLRLPLLPRRPRGQRGLLARGGADRAVPGGGGDFVASAWRRGPDLRARHRRARRRRPGAEGAGQGEGGARTRPVHARDHRAQPGRARLHRTLPGRAGSGADPPGHLLRLPVRGLRQYRGRHLRALRGAR